MQNLNITFIGGGNMAEALISGLIQSGHSSHHICVSDINENRLNNLQQRYDVKIDNNNVSAISKSDILLLAVKPQQMDNVLAGISEHLPSELTVISIAAGINMLCLKQFLNSEDAGVVRVMPNTPALVGAGMSVLFSDANEVHKRRAEYVLAASGETAWVDEEKHMHAVTAVSGSGPAYFFLLAEIMQAAGESLGLLKQPWALVKCWSKVDVMLLIYAPKSQVQVAQHKQHWMKCMSVDCQERCVKALLLLANALRS
jgi:pyrroline-5-carboxylate reductase